MPPRNVHRSKIIEITDFLRVLTLNGQSFAQNEKLVQRKMSEEEESEPKKQKSALRAANSASTADTISSMDQFAASDDE